MTTKWTYEPAVQTLVREVFRRLNKGKNRDEDCLFMAQIAWEATFAFKVKNGDDPRDAIQVLLEDQADPKVAEKLLSFWDETMEDIDTLPREDDDEATSNVTLLDDFRRRMQEKFSYADDNGKVNN